MRAAAQRWAHGRRIPDVLREYAARGDLICVEVAGRTFTGAVCAVGDDRIDLAIGDARVTVRTAFSADHRAIPAPVTIRRLTRARAGGGRLPSARTTFRSRLLELEGDATPVRVGIWMGKAEFEGTIVVGHDHVILSGDGELVVPAAWIAYVGELSRTDR